MSLMLYDRSRGVLGPQTFARLHTYRCLTSFAAASHISFHSIESGSETPGSSTPVRAHSSGVNCLALERFDGRILVSGGADATLKLWDLEQVANPHARHIYSPAAIIPRRSERRKEGHTFGVTALAFYPFDQNAFLSSSHDGTVKLWATETARLSKTFDLQERVHGFAVSPVGHHLTVACATEHPNVRLVDLRAGAAVHALPAPGAGAVLAAAWSPRHEHVLLSGSMDGCVRVWDVRRAGGPIGALDFEDSIGVSLCSASETKASSEAPKKAHLAPVTGTAFTDDGSLIITAGQDRKIRVWNADTGANTLAAFGPTVKSGGQTVPGAAMFVSPTGTAPPGKEVLFWGNETEIVAFDLQEGTVLNRLRDIGTFVTGVRAPESPQRQTRQDNANSTSGGYRSTRNRVTSLAWRGSAGYGGSSGTVMGGRNGAGGTIYSGNLDGTIRCWQPAWPGEDGTDDELAEDDEVWEQSRKRKRKVLDDAYRSLMGTRITFTGDMAREQD